MRRSQDCLDFTRFSHRHSSHISLKAIRCLTDVLQTHETLLYDYFIIVLILSSFLENSNVGDWLYTKAQILQRPFTATTKMPIFNVLKWCYNLECRKFP